MEKINYPAGEYILKSDVSFKQVLDKINEIVGWINEHEKLVKLTMQEVMRLMMEDMKNATKAKTTHSTGTIT